MNTEETNFSIFDKTTSPVSDDITSVGENLQFVREENADKLKPNKHRKYSAETQTEVLRKGVVSVSEKAKNITANNEATSMSIKRFNRAALDSVATHERFRFCRELLVFFNFLRWSYYVSQHLLRLTHPRQQIKIFVILSLPAVCSLLLLYGISASGVVLLTFEGVQEQYMNMNPAMLTTNTVFCFKMLLWQYVVIRCAGLLFQIGVGIIGCDMSHYLLRFCIVYFVSSFLSGIAVSLLYHNTRPSNLRDAGSKKIFPKVVYLFVVQDIIFRAARMSHGGRSLVLMLETVPFGFWLGRRFPAADYGNL